MTEDRVYPSTKPILNPPSSHQTLNGGTNNNPPPSFPPTKSQLYGASRPTYRPQPKQYHQKRSRSCCCSCCLWTTFIIIALILLTAITGAVFYVIYRPHRPSFSVTTLRIPQFNITTSSSKDSSSSSHLNSKLDLTISARNPNKRVVFYYDPIIVSVKSNGIEIGDGSFPSLIHQTKNTTLLKASLTSSSATELDSVSVKSLKSDLKKKSGLPLDIQLDTKVRVKMGGLKTKKVGIRVSCSGIHAVVSKTSKASSSTNADCKVKLRIKIWKWTIG